MAEIHHILGAIFRDIAQSVFSSDLYSRDISHYYEQDPLLRHFPTPRTQVEEMDVQLKFAISNVIQNPTQSVDRESSAATIFIDFSYDLSEHFFDALSDALEGKQGIARETWRKLNSLEQRIYLRQDLLKYFQRNQGSLIQEGEFQVDEALNELEGLITRRVKWMLSDSELSDEQVEQIQEAVLKALKLKKQLQALIKPLRFAWQNEGDFKVEVEVLANKLQDLPESILGSVNVKTTIRNYVWSEVEHECRKWWSLTPE